MLKAGGRKTIRKRNLIWLLGFAAISVLAMASACGDGNGSKTPVANGDSITISMTDNVFDLSEISIPVDTEVRITVVNDGLAVHNMRVLSKDAEGEDFQSDTIVNTGDSSTFTVKFTNKGEFAFRCDYHLPDMVGTITVE
ncbi:MAG TPA: cupredoxin domain-containing protein [Dehalococcoidia bacterium]|nr:cupredoxin domain-containing protein [Dehalococcoidia bacterium]